MFHVDACEEDKSNRAVDVVIGPDHEFLLQRVTRSHRGGRITSYHFNRMLLTRLDPTRGCSPGNHAARPEFITSSRFAVYPG